jgi:hypothetical protein
LRGKEPPVSQEIINPDGIVDEIKKDNKNPAGELKYIKKAAGTLNTE